MANDTNHQDNLENIQELLSAYLDDEVTAEERTLVEQALATSPELRQELEVLRQTVAMVKALPPVAAPRPFTLSEIDVQSVAPAPKKAFWLSGWAGGLALLATTLVCVLVAGGIFLGTRWGQGAFAPADIARLDQAVVPRATEVETAEALEAAPAVEEAAEEQAVEAAEIPAEARPEPAEAASPPEPEVEKEAEPAQSADSLAEEALPGTEAEGDLPAEMSDGPAENVGQPDTFQEREEVIESDTDVGAAGPGEREAVSEVAPALPSPLPVEPTPLPPQPTATPEMAALAPPAPAEAGGGEAPAASQESAVTEAAPSAETIVEEDARAEAPPAPAEAGGGEAPAASQESAVTEAAPSAETTVEEDARAEVPPAPAEAGGGEAPAASQESAVTEAAPSAETTVEEDVRAEAPPAPAEVGGGEAPAASQESAVTEAAPRVETTVEQGARAEAPPATRQEEVYTESEGPPLAQPAPTSQAVADTTEAEAPPEAEELGPEPQSEPGRTSPEEEIVRLVTIQNQRLLVEPGLIQIEGRIEAVPGTILVASLRRNGSSFQEWANPNSLQSVVQPGGQIFFSIQVNPGRTDADLFGIEPASYEIIITTVEVDTPVAASVYFDTFAVPAAQEETSTPPASGSGPPPSATLSSQPDITPPGMPTSIVQATPVPPAELGSSSQYALSESILGVILIFLLVLLLIVGILIWLVINKKA